MFARGLRPPIVQTIEIDGRGGDHLLEMRLGQTAVPGLTQVTDAHALRQGPFHPGTGGVLLLERRRLLMAARGLEDGVLLPRA